MPNQSLDLSPWWRSLLERSVQQRAGQWESGDAALRLFNGFYEGLPELVVDLYGRTLLLYGYGAPEADLSALLDQAQAVLLEMFPGVASVVQKQHTSQDAALRRGKVSFGSAPVEQVCEHGVVYALDLMMNQDASFYLDTRELRAWLLQRARGWHVLNTFAYTGSLGVAALAGGAAHVAQVDRSRKFLELARRSAMLNHLDLGCMKLHAADFFSQVAAFKRLARLFDCVIVDPPFFSSTAKGVVNLVSQAVQVINKVRPLVKDGGRLVVINNALFLSGEEYMRILDGLCTGGYLALEAIIPVPQDITGYPETCLTPPPSAPAPFNHPTKIVVLRVRRK